jgi:hypothetical protein
MSKIAAADAVIWMDEMQYERHGFVNRNRFEDGAWMTVPVADEDTFVPINRVRIADPSGRARAKIARTIAQRIGLAEAQPYYVPLMKQHIKGLAALNLLLLENLMWDLNRHGIYDFADHWHIFQSHLAAGRYTDTSEGLAAMVAEIGGTVWLSGSSGRNYLNEQPFHDRGIEVQYWQHEGPNPCALSLLAKERMAA